MTTRILAFLIIAAWTASVSAADIAPEVAGELDIVATPNPHWVWVTDISYPAFLPGKAHLLDAGKGDYLGMFTMGYGLSPLGLPKHGKSIYAAETHYSRTYRGDRTDVISIYNARTLDVEGEIEIPAKKLSGVTMTTFVGLTDNDRYFLLYNFTPTQSVSVVDVANRKFANEIDTAGCGLVMPTGDRSFAMLCGDGSLVEHEFDEGGKKVSTRSAGKIFDSKIEFLTEKAVRYRDSWIFVTNTGEVRRVDFSGDKPNLAQRWPLFTPEETAAGWFIGGQQHLAVHEASGRLYAVVHQGQKDSHKDPGKHVNVYAIESGKRLSQIELERDASSIQVTQGDDSLLLATNAYPNVLDVYDTESGKLQRSIADVAVTPMLLQLPVTTSGGNQ